MIVLYRVDNRMIHAQVLKSWIPHLEIDFLAVVNDEFSRDNWRRDLAAGAAGGDVEIAFWSLSEAAGKSQWLINEGVKRAMVLFASPSDFVAYLAAGAGAPEEINIGGLHYALGKVSLGRYRTFSEEDRGALKELSRRGIKLDARSTPLDEPVDLGPMLA